MDDRAASTKKSAPFGALSIQSSSIAGQQLTFANLHIVIAAHAPTTDSPRPFMPVSV